jgi:hypothetical protein
MLIFPSKTWLLEHCIESSVLCGHCISAEPFCTVFELIDLQGDLKLMMLWLGNLGSTVSTALASLDATVLKELITRCLSNWQIMKTDKVYIKLIGGDTISPVSCDFTE